MPSITGISTLTGGGTAPTTYYFNASDAAATDPNAVWTNDANAFDGSTSTTADTTTNGSEASNYLMAEGTDAPTTGNGISFVRARGNWSGTGSGQFTVYTNGLAESLGVISMITTTGWSPYVTLAIPSGDWTWQKVSDLEVKVYKVSGGNFSISRMEVEVTYNPPTITF